MSPLPPVSLSEGATRLWGIYGDLSGVSSLCIVSLVCEFRVELTTSSHLRSPGVSTVPGMQMTQQVLVRWMEAEALTSFCAAEQALDPSYSHSLWFLVQGLVTHTIRRVLTCVAYAGLNLMTFMLLLPKFYDYRHTTPYAQQEQPRLLK